MPSFHFSSSEDLQENRKPRAFFYARGDKIAVPPEFKTKSSYVHNTLCTVTVALRRSLLVAFRSALESPFTHRPLPQSHRLRLSARQALRDTSLSHRFVFIIIALPSFVKQKFKIYLCQYFLSSERYIIASAIWSAFILSIPSRSAIVLATLSTLS